MALLFVAINGLLLAACMAMIRWSTKWSSGAGQIIVLIVFGLGTLLFGACTAMWTFALFTT